MLELNYSADGLIECGCDEAGRGSLVGDVFAAAVILPDHCVIPELNDSKKLTEKVRYRLRLRIEQCAVAWAVGRASAEEIDKYNILHASFLAMHRAIDALHILPERLLIDGNRFDAHSKIPHHCIIKGDAKFASIAAASILAKTYRDDYMAAAHKRYPSYGWDRNKGYPTPLHRKNIEQFGPSPLHRYSFIKKISPISDR
ncbi:MAG: ribonuclease HII [Bacteroidales bacterium]|nr:ribonuclease HII [Porphyromonas sp.]MDD6933828.1 ribonuclease HII [Bacteroidales bacterium]MDY3102828.1 ribonuclease HII [Porphyromonas sp.]